MASEEITSAGRITDIEETNGLASDSETTVDLGPILCNDEGFPVHYGTDYVDVIYCGRDLGQEVIPGSDGRCGPTNGPPCKSCMRMLTGPGRLDVLHTLFPGLKSQVLISALRKIGGILQGAVAYLTDLGASSLSKELALPGAKPFGAPPNTTSVVNSADVDAVIGVLGYLDRTTAEAALRRNNSPDEAVAYILDTSEETLASACAEDLQAIPEFLTFMEEFRIRRNTAIQDIENAPLPEKIAELQKNFSLAYDGKGLENARLDGHDMELVTELEREDNSETKNFVCSVCSTSLPSAYSGSSRCKNCHLCEVCVKSKVVYKCPVMGNGGHLHPHPLAPTTFKRKDFSCDVCNYTGPRMVWCCEECDFDVCYICMANNIPKNFHRVLGKIGVDESDTDDESSSGRESNSFTENEDEDGTVDENEGDVEQEEDSEDDDSHIDPEDDSSPNVTPTDTHDEAGSNGFNELAAERITAAHWEGVQREDFVGDVMVGTGEIGTTSLSPSARSNRRPSQDQRSLPTNSVEARLSNSATRSLASFSTGSPGKNGNVPVTPASDINHVENLLHRARDISDVRVKKALEKALAFGKIEIAGTLLLANAFSPSRNRTPEGDDEETLTCFCGDPINADTAPDGAVGCLNGHAMHSGCASDQLLGGGLCPTCRQPLCYPRVPGPEAQKAMEFAAAELERCKQEEEEKLNQEFKDLADQGIEMALKVGDIVRISSDVKFCSEEMMKVPGKAGWSSDLEVTCGRMGRVTSIIEVDGKVVSFRVRTADIGHSYGYGNEKFTCRKCDERYNTSLSGLKCIHCHLCQKCCQKSASHSCSCSSSEWNWVPTLVRLVCHANSAVLWDKALATEDVASVFAAEQHLAHLRAELKAVSAGRTVVKAEMEKVQPTLAQKQKLTRGLSSNSSSAVFDTLGNISSADWQRARHLLLLARKWGNSDRARAKRASLYALIRSGEIDSVARIVRRHNAARVADDLRWADAVSNSEYIVEQFARVDLYTYPSNKASKTGYSLKPKSIFRNKAEFIDELGRLWLLVDESFFVNFSEFDGKVKVSNVHDMRLTRTLVGMQVCRGPDWTHGDEDGGEGGVGTITRVTKLGDVCVEWKKTGRRGSYKAGASDRYDLSFASLPQPPPQGWLCTRPGGMSSPSVVNRARNALRCFSCGDGLFPSSKLKERFSTVEKNNKLYRGKCLLIAATLEPVEVSSLEGDKIFCTFPGDTKIAKDTPGGSNNLACAVWYRPQDLVYPESQEVASIKERNDYVMFNGHLRSRSELVLLLGNRIEARKAWDKAKSKIKKDGYFSIEESDESFASCLRGHLLHARCFQGALLAGHKCPVAGCTESLWFPKVKYQQQDETTCCGGDIADDDASVMQDMNELVGHSELMEARGDTGNLDENDVEGLIELKMCPVCCSGPMFNTNCGDMMAHHGHCSVKAIKGRGSDGACLEDGNDFRVSAHDIALKLLKMKSTQTVADVLPKCPTHKSLVMFNGCMNCGHLFTDTSWDDMPKWNRFAKENLRVDKKKREAADLLATEIRKQCALLQFERDALWSARSKEVNLCKSHVLNDLPPPPQPVDDYRERGCGPDCTTTHRCNSLCLVCGERWATHNDHNCRDGIRGSWRFSDSDSDSDFDYDSNSDGDY